MDKKHVPRTRTGKASSAGEKQVVVFPKAGKLRVATYANDLVSAGKKFPAIGKIESGLRVKTVADLATKLDVPTTAIQTLVKISPSTFGRRQKAGVLSSEESDRVYRLQAVVQKTTDFYEGNAEAARKWLSTPAPALGGVRPLSVLGNEAGVREVEALLNRLEHGVFT